ncbi:MAG: oligosaccharide flippase family protein [Candidatus Krumholzibacteriota bacterium]|nr:oligosaccharide flippase family protein [Candidatus Krumholzibacteriota bacterium]
MDRTRGPVDLSTAKVVSDTFFISASRIVVLGLKSIRGIVLGRLLGPTLYGVLNIPAPFVDILRMLSNIGFNTGVVRLVPAYRQRGRADLARMIFRSTEALTLGLGFIWCILLVVFSRPIALHFAHRPDAILPIRVYAAIIPFLAVNLFYAAAYLAVQRGKLRGALTLVHGLLVFLLPLGVVLWRRDPVHVIAAFLAAELLGAIVFAAFFHRRILRGLGDRVGPLFRGMREVATFGLPFFLADISWNLINTIDRLMVQFYLPVELFAFYTMAALVITALTMIASTAGLALVPSLTAALAAGDRRAFERQVLGTSRIGFLVLVPLSALLLALAGDIFSLLLRKYLPSVGVIEILVYIGGIILFCRVGWAVLVAYGRGRMAAAAYAFAAAWNFAGNRLLIPRLGIEGAAIATLSTFVMLAILLQSMQHRVSGTRVPVGPFLHAALLSAVFPGIGWLLRGAGPALRFPAIIVGGGCLYLVFAIRTNLLAGADLDRAQTALEPRAGVRHVRIALWLLDLLARIGRRRPPRS